MQTMADYLDFVSWFDDRDAAYNEKAVLLDTEAVDIGSCCTVRGVMEMFPRLNRPRGARALAEVADDNMLFVTMCHPGMTDPHVEAVRSPLARPLQEWEVRTAVGGRPVVFEPHRAFSKSRHHDVVTPLLTPSRRVAW
jgi:hypothetical protein